MVLKQIKRPLPTEIDDEPELIDLSALFTSTSDEDLKLNARIIVEQPVRWWINESGDSVKLYKDGRLEGESKGTSKYQPLCIEFPRDTSRLWRTTLGERIKPTQISSLLSQNIDDTSRSPNFCYKWDQPDEGYYKARAKEGLAEFIADTRSNYYCVPEGAPLRWMFKCPEQRKTMVRVEGVPDCSQLDESDGCSYFEDCSDYGSGHMELPPPKTYNGDILIYVNPKTGQAEYICPRCSYNNSKMFGGDGHPVKHPITREMRSVLSEAGIIPSKEYKYKDRTVDVDAIITLVNTNPGISYYRIDQAFGWPKGTAERLIKKQLKGKVKVRKGRKGYRVYLA